MDLEGGMSPETLIKTISQETELELTAIQEIVNNVVELRDTYLNPECCSVYKPKQYPRDI